MTYKLVVTDMDGTLLSSKGAVSNENKEVIKELIEKGIHVAVATGRIYTSARVYAKYVGLKTPIIACNGAVVRNLADEKTIYRNYISKEDCLKVVEICHKYGLYFHFYTEDVFYTENLERSTLLYSEWNKTIKEDEQIDIQKVEDSYRLIQTGKVDIFKFVIMNDDLALLRKVRAELEQSASVECSRSWRNNIEVMNKGVTKGKAVKSLADSFGIKAEEVICFGDSENDISMIEYAGLGVAMGNAEDMVKERANYVTESNDEDGIAKAIRKFVL